MGQILRILLRMKSETYGLCEESGHKLIRAALQKRADAVEGRGGKQPFLDR